MFGIGGKSIANKTDTATFDNNRSDIGTVALTYLHRLSDNTTLKGVLSLSGTQISKFTEILQSGMPLALRENYSKSFRRISFSLRQRITDAYFLEAGVVNSGLQYDFFLENLDPTNTAYQQIINFNEKDNTNINQVFFCARQYLSSNLFAFYGMHFMSFGLTRDHSLEPRTGIKWQWRENRSISAGYGKHSRVENLQYYLARDHQPGGAEIQINKDLGFTRAHHAVISYDHGLAADRSVKTEIYHQWLYNIPINNDYNSPYASINEDTGFITDTLVNAGSGRNYGVEVSLEKSFSNNFYYLINGSLFRSEFSIGQQAQHSTAYDGNYSIHLLAGKEFHFRMDRNQLGLNVKLTTAGGRRYTPIDIERSNLEGKAIYDYSRAFESQLSDYFRTDVQMVYKINSPRYAVEWRLDIQNVTNYKNDQYYFYDLDTRSVQLKKQVGFIPLLSCRVEF
jgi:hypothetical protein